MNKPDIKIVVDNLKGKPVTYEPKVRAVNLVMFRSLDPDAAPEKWTPIKPVEVPEFLKSDDVIAKLVEGFMVEPIGADPHFYRAEQLVVTH